MGVSKQKLINSNDRKLYESNVAETHPVYLGLGRKIFSHKRHKKAQMGSADFELFVLLCG
jgi:hypothetical protein